MIEDLAPIPGLDKLLGSLCLISLLLGTPANIISFIYFYRQTPYTALSTLYTVIAATDAWISFNGYPIAVLLLSSRDPGLFGDYTFRQLWGLTWEPLPYFSVFLVLVISLMRTVKIVWPTHRVRQQHVVILIGSYAAILVVRFLVGFTFFGKYGLSEVYPGYPYIHISDKTYTAFDLYLSLVSLAFPIVPIIVSASISMTMLRLSKRTAASTHRSDDIKNYATVTVLIFTLVYITCNIPVFLCYLRFAIWKLSGWNVDIFKGPSVFLDRYIWILTYITQLQLNSFLNPCVYLLRMRRFRTYLKELVAGAARALRILKERSQNNSRSGKIVSNNQSHSNNKSSTDRTLVPYCGEIKPDPIMESVLMSAFPRSLSTSNASQTQCNHIKSQPCSSSSQLTDKDMLPANSPLESDSKVSPIAEKSNYCDIDLQSSFSEDAISVIIANHWASET
ncbi:hypothetical protein ACHWQZ_G015016 [Mnemiopsis leidyi]